jgi:hypothetical protein
MDLIWLAPVAIFLAAGLFMLVIALAEVAGTPVGVR